MKVGYIQAIQAKFVLTHRDSAYNPQLKFSGA